MPTRKLKPFHFFLPITRVDEEQRIVEGYAFVNEVVEGDGGIQLRRSAMEAATPDYLKWGAVRSMHQPLAAGTASAPGCGVEWDETGAFLRAKIVDDNEWKKVQGGVYKGFSVGVIPRLMRGKAIEQCVWAENSLVDRPKDPGAIITSFRAEGFDADAEVDVEVVDEEEAVERAAETETEADAEPTERKPQVLRTLWTCGQDGHEHASEDKATTCIARLQRAATLPTFADLVADREPETLVSLAFDLLRYVVWRIKRSDATNKEELVRTAAQQFADYVGPILGNEQPPAVEMDDYYYVATAEVTRLADAETDAPLREALEWIQTQRGQTSDTVPKRENLDPSYDPQHPEECCPHCGACQERSSDGQCNRCGKAWAENRSAADWPENQRAVLADLQRLNTLTTEHGSLLQRVETLTTELQTAQDELATERQQRLAAEERANTLERAAAPGRGPVRFPQALERDFLANRGNPGEQAEVAAQLAEYQELQRQAEAEKDQEKRQTLIERMLAVKGTLRERGYPVL